MEWIGYIGRRTLAFGDQFLVLAAMGYRLACLGCRRPPEGRAMVRKVIIEQIYFTAVQALPLIIPIALLIGSVLIVQFALLGGQYDTGKMMVLLVIRELGPMITALIVILRSATSVTIELSYMSVGREIEAIELAGIDPMRILCVPRLIGITTAVFSLFLVFGLLAIAGGYGLVWVGTYVPVGNFYSQVSQALTATDLVVGGIKAMVFGVTITIISIYHGLVTRDQITQIPQATSRAAVQSFFFCLAWNAFISLVFYL